MNKPETRWELLGNIFNPEDPALPLPPWWRSHAANPVAIPLDNDRIQILVNFRDADNQSGVGWITLNPSRSQTIEAISPAPLLTPGTPGHFDEHGVSLGSVVTVENTQYLYYLGWQHATDVPWRNWIGLASRPAGDMACPFERVQATPVLGQSAMDPHSVSYPWVIRRENDWQMWYGSSTRWEKNTEAMRHRIHAASSPDGIHWQSDPEPALDLNPDTPNLFALSRPCLWQDATDPGQPHQLWFSERGSHYQIAMATSSDGSRWQRSPQSPALPPATADWEDKARCYAHVFSHGSRRWMLYNGNGYGKTGIGLAREVGG